MKVQQEITIHAPRAQVWQLITDIEGSVKTISGIENIKILEKPENGLIGLKWEETRTMFGKTATEIMWITDVVDGYSYKTQADGPGVIYISSLELRDDGAQTQLTMGFDTVSSSLGSKIVSSIMGFFFSKATRDAIKQDLIDIKIAAEG